MTPILRRALLAALLAALWSAPSFAQPAEPLDVSSSPGLLPEELAYLQEAEGGRYRLQESHVFDAQSGVLLTKVAAEPLLRTHAQGVVAELRQKQKASALREADRKQALLLYWYRTPLLPAEDAAFLASLNPAAFGKVPSFALGAKPAAQPAAAGASAGLAERLLQQVDLAGDPAQKTALRDAVNMMLATPTGRQLAEEFVATGAQARVSFTAYPNTQVLEVNGKKTLYGIYGTTGTSQEVINVSLNQDFLKTDRAFYQHHLAPVLAHELLGHGLEAVKAKKAGVWQTYNTYYRENETNARLVGWSVEAELGGKIHTADMFSYLRDPEAYHKSLQITLPYYSTVMSPAEGRDAAGTLAARLQRTKEELGKIPGYIASWESWLPIAEHFIAAHKLARDSFRSLLEQIDNMSKKYLPSRIEVLKGIVAHLESSLTRFQGQGGAAASRGLKTDFSKGFFAGEEARVKSNREHLEVLLKGRSYEPFSPPPSGQVSLEKLREMYTQDKKDHPEHWRK